MYLPLQLCSWSKLTILPFKVIVFEPDFVRDESAAALTLSDVFVTSKNPVGGFSDLRASNAYLARDLASASFMVSSATSQSLSSICSLRVKARRVAYNASALWLVPEPAEAFAQFSRAPSTTSSYFHLHLKCSGGAPHTNLPVFSAARISFSFHFAVALFLVSQALVSAAPLPISTCSFYF